MMSNSDSENTDAQYPTTGIQNGDNHGRIDNAHGDAASKQRRLVGNVHEGQVLVDAEAVRAEDTDTETSFYDSYADKRWTIANVTADGRHLTLRELPPEDATHDPAERTMTVAEFAADTIQNRRWMFLKDSFLANTWNSDSYGVTACKNCGVNTDRGLSREEHYTSEINGVEWDVTLRRCVGCGMYGNYAHHDKRLGSEQFTTGVLEGPRAPWDADN